MRCGRCGERLNKRKAVWLELDGRTNIYYPVSLGSRPDSQGCFEFGVDCARAVLANGGRNVRIGRLADRKLYPLRNL